MGWRLVVGVDRKGLGVLHVSCDSRDMASLHIVVIGAV
jgi:hypothetical protein